MATVVFAGGGTAGHIEPALAVAKEWMKLHSGDTCIFIGTSSGLETNLVPAAGFELALIPKVKIARTPSLSWLKIPTDLIKSVIACRRILKTADLLIGFGGYVSAPAYIGAKITGVPIVIHEANAKPGWANRLGAKFTDTLAVANPVSDGAFSDALLTGLPLRKDVADAFNKAQGDWQRARQQAKERIGFPIDSPLIAIMGGSQGSVAINSVVQSTLNHFNSAGYYVLHAVGRLNNVPASADRYRPVSYIENMADVYLAADLIIARSGAVTCSEFRTLGRYALFVPLPIGNGEQSVNAASLVLDQRAVTINQAEFSSEYLQKNLAQLLEQAGRAPSEGNGQDMFAASKIAALAEFAIQS